MNFWNSDDEQEEPAASAEEPGFYAEECELHCNKKRAISDAIKHFTVNSVPLANRMEIKILNAIFWQISF